MAWCVYCRSAVDDNATKCPSCAKPLSDGSKVVRCPSCAKLIIKSAKQCKFCGMVFQAPAPPPAPPPAEEPAAPVESEPAPEAQPIAPAESASPAEEEGVVAGSVSFPTTAPSDVRETEATVEPEAAPPEPVLEEVVPIELVEQEETTALSDVREPKVRKKLPTWAKALIWIVASVLAFLLLFAIGARLFPDFFDSILYSHEELDIIRF